MWRTGELGPNDGGEEEREGSGGNTPEVARRLFPPNNPQFEIMNQCFQLDPISIRGEKPTKQLLGVHRCTVKTNILDNICILIR